MVREQDEKNYDMYIVQWSVFI